MRSYLIALAAFLLGIACGSFGPWVVRIGVRTVAQPPSPAAQTYIFDQPQFDSNTFLTDCMPKDGKALFSGAGSAGRTRYGYHGGWSAAWLGSADAEAVGTQLRAKLKKLVEDQGWTFGEGTGGLGGNDGRQSWSREFPLHGPEGLKGGFVFVSVVRDREGVCWVTMSYSVSHDAPRE